MKLRAKAYDADGNLTLDMVSHVFPGHPLYELVFAGFPKITLENDRGGHLVYTKELKDD
jgi:hypothetical protein